MGWSCNKSLTRRVRYYCILQAKWKATLCGRRKGKYKRKMIKNKKIGKKKKRVMLSL
jgi:hypothetical protein